MQDREVLGDVGVKLSQQPLRHPVALSAALGMRALARLEWLLVPRVVMAAADLAGNGGACFLCASVCEARYAPPPDPLPLRRSAPCILCCRTSRPWPMPRAQLVKCMAEPEEAIAIGVVAWRRLHACLEEPAR